MFFFNDKKWIEGLKPVSSNSMFCILSQEIKKTIVVEI